MKRIKRYLLILLLISVFGSASSRSIIDRVNNEDVSVSKSNNDNTIPVKCSVITLSKGGQVFFGGNDDYIKSDSYYWVDQGDDQNYGVIWIGQPDNVQQGVNEVGLAYDANGLPRVGVNPHNERLPVSGDYTIYPILILHECATVEEVITWINTHQWHSYMHDQMQFADATGDAVIISAGTDGEVVFSRKPQGDGFIVSTNFNVADHGNSFGYPCWRYDLASEKLDQLINQEKEISLQDAVDVLDAVHMEGGTSWTISSMVADLTNGLVYLYYFHQFDRPVVLNVKDELANPRAPGALSMLFPEDVRQEADRRYNEIQAKTELSHNIGLLWVASVLISLAFIFFIPVAGSRKLIFWIPAILLLGIPGLLAFIVIRNKSEQSIWKTALQETIGNIMPMVFSFVIVLVILVLIMINQGAHWIFQVGCYFILPLLLGLLVFQGPFLFSMSKKNFIRFLIKRLPDALVTTNLATTGIIIILLPLVNWSIQFCPLLPFSVWPVLIWWLIVVTGAIVGGILVFIYEYNTVKRGIKAWSVLINNGGEVQTSSWHELRWWIPGSYLLIILGFVVAVILQS